MKRRPNKIKLFRLYRHRKTGNYYVPTEITDEEISGIQQVVYFNVLTGKKYNRPLMEWDEDVLILSKKFNPRFQLVKKMDLLINREENITERITL